MCVLKHDHHCWFLGGCVGLRTEKHFMVWLFHCAQGTFIASYYLWACVAGHYGYEGGSWRLIYFFNPVLPVMMAAMGQVPLDAWLALHGVLGAVHFSSLIGSLCYFIYQTFLVYKGQTNYENTTNVRVYDVGPTHNFRVTFGKWGLLSFLLPFPFGNYEFSGYKWIKTDVHVE